MTRQQPEDPVGLDVHRITERLWLGAAPPVDAWEGLGRRLGRGAVVDLRAEARHDPSLLTRHGFDLLHLPVEDLVGTGPERLARGVTWARNHMDAGRPVLIHCRYGIGRSALLALCVRVSEGVAPLDALAELKRCRPVVSPSPRQLEAFCHYLRSNPELEGLKGRSVPTVNALGALVWR